MSDSVDEAGGAPTILLVAGTARSGSTMLDAMLGNRPGGFTCGEVVNQLRPWRDYHLQIRCMCGDPQCPIWTRLAKVPPRHFHRAVHESFGASIISDSSKDDRWILDTYRWGRRDGYRVVTLAVWKDPRELAYSFWRRTGELDQWRRHFVGYYSRLVDLEIPFLGVRLRDLTAEPAAVLGTTLGAAGLDYHPRQERYWEATLHQCRGSDSVRGRDGQAVTGLSYAEAPEDFVSIWNGAGLGDDPEVARVVSLLEQSVPASPIPVPGLTRYRPPTVPPSWYLKKRAHDVYRTTRLRVRSRRG